MEENKILDFLEEVLKNMPVDWTKLTTHRLDIYDEKRAKTQFLEQFEGLFSENNSELAALNALPTAFDYIRLGHPLSCVLEWSVAKNLQLDPDNVICFSSKTTPILSVIRKNLLEDKKTQIVYVDELPNNFIPDTVRKVYGYKFEVCKVDRIADIPSFEGSTIFISASEDLFEIELSSSIDFFISHNHLGSLIVVNGEQNKDYIPEIQHLRRRESIAMTPANCLIALQGLTGNEVKSEQNNVSQHKAEVINTIKGITGANTEAVIGSSGLSIQYAITMGLIHDALDSHPTKDIKIVVPPNCYGGTNDQARRVAACLSNVEVVDLPVDGNSDMVQSIDSVLEQIAAEDAIPFIIVEIPTNPRVEVPNLDQLKEALNRERKTAEGSLAVDPVFILDQTFCPNVHFLGEGDILASIRTISYVSGSKFPSGGQCTAGYCVANKKAEALMSKIELHLGITDNEATNLQYEILARQMPSMNQRIHDAYKNTREFVDFIKDNLAEAKINFVSEELAEQGFTPSVFSLDLPTKGKTAEEREEYKRMLNLKLINMMIEEIPTESKYCVSYGQLKGCYWTIPATSTQGTTKEADKDYIARVAISPDLDLQGHKDVFLDFVREIVD